MTETSFSLRNFVTVTSFASRKCETTLSRNFVTVVSLASRAKNFVTVMSFWRNLVTVVSRYEVIALSRNLVTVMSLEPPEEWRNLVTVVSLAA